MIKKLIIILFISIFSLLHISLLQNVSFSQTNNYIEKNDLETQYYQGIVKPSRKAILAYAVSGLLVQVPQEGLKVKEGEIVSKLDNGKNLIALTEADAAVESSKLSVETVQHNLNKTKRLLDEKILAPIALVEDEFKLKQAEVELKIAKTKLDVAKLNLNESNLTAPFDGVIINVKVTLGEQISAGQEVAELIDLSSLEVSLDLPNDIAGELKEGFSAPVLVEGSKASEASVKTILPILDPASGLQRVIWSIEPNNRIISGQYISIKPWK